MTIFGIHAYITLMNWSQFCVTLCYNYYMRNRIRHNSPIPMSFSHIVLCLVTLPLPLLQLLQNYYCYFCHCYCYFHITLLLNTLLQILSFPCVVELTTQLLIPENILWLPLCRINKFGLNTLPSKAVAIPYTCGLSRLISGAVAGEHSSIL